MQAPICPRCIAAYKSGKPWNGSDPQCAFQTGVFNIENWNCATANALRDCADQYGVSSKAVWCNDQWAVLLAWPEKNGFVLLEWYKSRGRTEHALFYSEGAAHSLTLVEAEQFLMDWSKNK